ncbi:MAG TPA: DUF2167 domain-containing protein [Puia sp.]|nr:DUF2167 domain-containing protein [Puia sp.]
MTRRLLTLPILLLVCLCTRANNPVDSVELLKKMVQQYQDSVDNTLKYSTGKVKPEGGNIMLDVPQGFKYLNKEQSHYVLTKLWGNPESAADEVIGMLFPEQAGPFTDSSFAFVISYTETGHIKDEDAGKINYDELLKNLQSEEKEENEKRVKGGYPSIHLVGWAQKPYYDGDRKILYWAKDLKFGSEDNENTLNYEIRILGRKGMVSLNAVGKMSELPLVNRDIAKVLNVAAFTDGNSYKDFNPKIDKVAAWTIGGLVAGKLLAKAGLFAIILKFLAPFWKAIVLFFVGIGAWFKKRLGRKKEPDMQDYYTPSTPGTPADEPQADAPPTLPEATPTQQ